MWTAPTPDRCPSYSDGGFDRRVRIVVLHDDVVVGVVEDRIPMSENKFRLWSRVATELQAHLLDVVVIDVTVAAGPDEFTDRQPGLGGHHVGEQRVAGDVE